MFIDNKEIKISGGLTRIVRLRAEYYEWLGDAHGFVDKLTASGIKADLFTFLQPAHDSAQYPFHTEADSIAVLPITTYENWWTKQIDAKTRNMIRKAEKSGVEIRLVEFSDEFVRGIKEIYDESRLRQGRPFAHYNEDFETLKAAHITFLKQSQFIGAFFKDELIGFIKLVHEDWMAHCMQIISKISHRSKAPTNALIAKAVEICADRSVPYLHYGIWSRRGLGDFKKNHGFQPFALRRYFVPLNTKGKMALRLKLHQRIADQLPGPWVDFLADVRNKLYAFMYR